MPKFKVTWIEKHRETYYAKSQEELYHLIPNHADEVLDVEEIEDEPEPDNDAA